MGQQQKKTTTIQYVLLLSLFYIKLFKFNHSAPMTPIFVCEIWFSWSDLTPLSVTSISLTRFRTSHLFHLILLALPVFLIRLRLYHLPPSISTNLDKSSRSPTFLLLYMYFSFTPLSLLLPPLLPYYVLILPFLSPTLPVFPPLSSHPGTCLNALPEPLCPPGYIMLWCTVIKHSNASQGTMTFSRH